MKKFDINFKLRKIKMNTQRREGESKVTFFFKNVLSASAAAMTAEILTIPIDTCKVRLQI